MNDDAGLDEVFLEPGGFFFGGPDVLIRTVLGSCVAIVLWHPSLRVGGMGHFMLPGRSPKARFGALPDGRYADETMEMFCERIVAYGTSPEEYEVKLFGGGNMFPEMYSGTTEADTCADVPCRNVRAARDIVGKYGFVLKAEHLGGTGHRALIFDLRDGAVYQRYTSVRSESQRRTGHE